MESTIVSFANEELKVNHINNLDAKKRLKEKVTKQLDGQTVAMILSFIGYEISNKFTFIDNPSFTISKNGYIKDWGSTSFAGDIFSFLMDYKDMGFTESVKYVADCLGITYE